MAIITLQPGKERPVLQRHPWIFSGAIARVQGNPEPGSAVDVQAANGEWLAYGTWSGFSQIRVRLFSWIHEQHLDQELIVHRLERAIRARRMLGLPETSSAYRLVYAESDGLPGLIVDRYGDFLVAQFQTQGVVAHQHIIVQALAQLLQPRGIYERSDNESREKEGLAASEGVLWGEEPPEQLIIHQAGDLLSLVNLRTGQKTGAYLDQALNRLRVAAYCPGQDVLDAFSYTGGFSIAAARAAAASITAIDSSQAALMLLQHNLEVNQLSTEIVTSSTDVFQQLRQFRNTGQHFDVIILDPPKFANNQGQVERATRGYKDINMIAMQLLRPGGVLASFSCSGLISADLFQKVVFGAALDARRDVQIIERLTQAPDHPVLLSFPEGEYLKGLVCRVW